jgi:hypothetical protein
MEKDQNITYGSKQLPFSQKAFPFLWLLMEKYHNQRSHLNLAAVEALVKLLVQKLPMDSVIVLILSLPSHLFAFVKNVHSKC